MNTENTQNHPLARLRHHVTGAIERGEKKAIAGIPANQPKNIMTTSSPATVRKFVTGGGREFALEGERFERSPWGTTLPAKQGRDQIEGDRRKVESLAVGDTASVAYGYHPRHGWKFCTVTRTE